MFGIFRCPFCNGYQGYDLRSRTAGCNKCGKRAELGGSRTYGPYKDQDSMRKVLWDLKSGEMNENEIVLSSEMLQKNDPQVKGKLKRSQKDELVLDNMGDESRSFEYLSGNLKGYGIDRDELIHILERLSIANKIYSPSQGIFKKV